MTQPKRKVQTVQWFAGFCVSLVFMYTGAVLSWPSPALPKLKSREANAILTDSQLSWIAALANIGALPGCFISQVLVETIGRTRSIYISAIPGVIGSSIKLYTVLPWLLYVARLLEGLTIGMVAVISMIYITEIADKEMRGPLGTLVQVMMNTGILLMYGIGPFVSYTVLNIVVVCLPILFVIMCLWLPESPYYHLKDGRIDAARKVYKVIKQNKDEKWIDEQLGSIRAHVRESMANKGTMTELLTNQIYRKSLCIIAGLKIIQYMTGALAIQSYLELIFRQSTSISGPHASIIYGFVQITVGLVATFLIGAFGRRLLLTVSSLGVGISLTAVGLFFFLQDYVKVSPETLASISYLPLIGILGFNIMFTIGLGNIPFIMQVELFPINVKAVASSLATMSACIFAFIITKCYQNVKDALGHYSVFWIFAAIAYSGVFFVYFFVPETKDKTLEEIQDFMHKNYLDEAQDLQNDVKEISISKCN